MQKAPLPQAGSMIFTSAMARKAPFFLHRKLGFLFVK
jgi:hypothetical protein